MFIHFQFTVGAGPTDPTPLVIAGVVGPDIPLQGGLVQIIQEFIAYKLEAVDVDATRPHAPLGFRPNPEMGEVPDELGST